MPFFDAFSAPHVTNAISRQLNEVPWRFAWIERTLNDYGSLDGPPMNYVVCSRFNSVLVYGLVHVNTDDFFQLTTNKIRGHCFKPYKQFSSSNTGSSFFVKRMVNVWNSLSITVDFSSLAAFKRLIQLVNFNEYLTVYKFAVPTSNCLTHALCVRQLEVCMYYCTVRSMYYLYRCPFLIFAYYFNFSATLFCIFIARQHTDARYWYSKSVCLSVCLSVRPFVCPLRSSTR